MAQTTTTSFTAFLPTFWDSVLGENLFPNLTLYGYGTKRGVPRNFGTVIKIPRLKNRVGVVRAVCAQSEGNLLVTNPNMTVCGSLSEFVSGTLKQFAGAYRHSDVVIMTALSDVVGLSLKALARDLALTMDTHIGDQISGSGSRIMHDGSAATASGSTRTASFLRATAFLKASTILDANNNPRPAGGFYPAVIHPFQQFELQSQLTGNSWLEMSKYKGSEEPEMLYRAELGRIFGCAITTSTNIRRLLGGTTANKHISGGASGWMDLVFAPEAFYVTEITDMTAKTYVKQLGSGGAWDPVNSVATVGAKVFFTAIPAVWSASTTESRMVRICTGGSRY